MSPVSLLVPCYNASPFLPRLIEAVRAQTTPFAEILCYDDGSTDDTVAVARGLGLNIIRGNPNRGVAYARNRLVEAAAAEWIHFHDADDLIDPTYLERLAPACDAHYDVVSCDADWIDEVTRKLVIAWRYEPAELARAPFPHLLTHAMGLNNSIIRRRAWAAVDGCNESLAIWEDADIHIRLARSGARFYHVPAVLTWSLRRNESFSHEYRRNWTCRVQALEGYAAGPLPPEARPVLAVEAERAASELAMLGADEVARRSLAVCRSLGFSSPLSRHPAMRLLKPFVPTLTLLRWQQRRRQSAKLAG
jgi:glycosyltransferase involved in cell wall biosynthesis